MFGWGANEKSQLGLLNDNDFYPHELDFPSICLENEDSLSSISCGKAYSVYVTKNGHVYSCGDSSQLHSLNTSKINSKIVRVSCGGFHALAITSDFGIASWGSNSHGQLGKKFSDDHRYFHCENSPSYIYGPLSGLPIVQVSCGRLHSLALARNGTLYSWGSNNNGQLGLGSKFANSHTPQPVKSLFSLPLRSISSGGRHSLVVTFSGSVFSWGCNRFGQLGIESKSDTVWKPKPIKELRSQSITSLACGCDHSAVWSTFTGKVFTFGRNSAYQLGHNERSDSRIPEQPPFLKYQHIANVVCGDLHTIFITKYQTLFASGSNVYGQLGNNTHSENMYFYDFSIDNCDLAAIASGSNHVICVDSKLVDSPSFIEFTIRHINDVAWLLKYSLKSTIPNNKMKLIEEVFSSSNCINASFLLPEDEHMKCSNSNCGLDYKLMSEMSDCRNPQVAQRIAECLEAHVLPTLQADVPDYESLRLYFILVNLPIFLDMNHLNRVIIPFSKALMSLTEIPCKAIKMWLIAAPTPFILRYVAVFKEAASFIFRNKHIWDPDVHKKELDFILKVLTKIYFVNQIVDEPVKFEEFYIDNLFEMLRKESEYLCTRMNEVRYTTTNDEMNDLEKNLRFMQISYNEFFNKMPFICNISDKALFLQWCSRQSMQNAVFQNLYIAFNPQPNYHFSLEIDRENLLPSTLAAVRSATSLDLRKPLTVKFTTDTMGYKGAGVVKEFFFLALQEIMDPECGLFEVIHDTQVHWFMASEQPKLELFYLAGVLCGLAIYNDAIIDLKFPEVVYKKLVDHKLTLNDLSDIDPKLCTSFKEMLLYNDDDFSEVYDFEFQIDTGIGGRVQTVNLIEDGGNIKVTQENKHQFVEAYQTYLISGKIAREFEQFKLGFFKICDRDILLKFHPNEILQLVAGCTVYELSELKRTTKYEGDFNEEHDTIRFFWDVLSSFTLEELKKFLEFLTGTSRVPIAGLSSVNLRIIPQEFESEATMPSSYVCHNILLMPCYKTLEKLSEKLKNAINGKKRFDDLPRRN